MVTVEQVISDEPCGDACRGTCVYSRALGFVKEYWVYAIFAGDGYLCVASDDEQRMFSLFCIEASR